MFLQRLSKVHCSKELQNYSQQGGRMWCLLILTIWIFKCGDLVWCLGVSVSEIIPETFLKDLDFSWNVEVIPGEMISNIVSRKGRRLEGIYVEGSWLEYLDEKCLRGGGCGGMRIGLVGFFANTLKVYFRQGRFEEVLPWQNCEIVVERWKNAGIFTQTCSWKVLKRAGIELVERCVYLRFLPYMLLRSAFFFSNLAGLGSVLRMFCRML